LNLETEKIMPVVNPRDVIQRSSGYSRYLNKPEKLKKALLMMAF
jgi:hypothetical protein